MGGCTDFLFCSQKTSLLPTFRAFSGSRIVYKHLNAVPNCEHVLKVNMSEQPMNTLEIPTQYWSLNHASKELGINKSTLSNDAAKGKIQWHDQQDGSRKFFAPELYTFYAERLKKRRERAEHVLNGSTSPENEQAKPIENKGLNGVVQAKDELIASLKAQIEDLRGDRDEWRKQADETARRLEDTLQIMKALPAPAGSQKPQKPGFFARLLGRG